MPIAVQERDIANGAQELMHCAQEVAPRWTYAYIGVDGSVWMSQLATDDHGIGAVTLWSIGLIVAILLLVPGRMMLRAP